MGRKLAEQWKGVFVESSAKQNEVSSEFDYLHVSLQEVRLPTINTRL